MTNLTQLGRYELEKHLGSGAYADVYRAVDRTLKRTVALKVLKPALMADMNAFGRFVQEAQVAASLFHPQIATVLDMGEADGHYYLAMRYVDGQSLDKILEQGGALDWKTALKYCGQIGEALQFAHNKELVHRDVKPQNIIVSETEGAVLTDFGLVRAMASSRMTTTGAMLGTPHYMAPEIWETVEAGPAADQYALACILVELLTGKVLFDGKTPPIVMAKHFKPLELPLNWKQDVPAGLDKVLRKALAHEPGDRYGSIAEFIQAVRSLPEAKPAPAVPAPEPPIIESPIAEEPASVPPPEKLPMAPSTPPAEPAPPKKQSLLVRKWPIFLGGAILLCLVVFGIFSLIPSVNIALTDPPAEITCPNQLKAEYYNNPDLSGTPQLVQCENWPINWDWGLNSPGNGIPEDSFSVRWSGDVYFDTGEYTFIVISDDGARLWLDGSLILDEWREQTPTEFRSTNNISAGNHSIVMEYFENSGGAAIYLWWDLSTNIVSSENPVQNGEEITDAQGVPMRLVPAGEFTMGSNDGDPEEKPAHAVYLGAFYMDKYEVTNAFYRVCVDAGVCGPPLDGSSQTHSSYYGNPEFDNYPVVFVDWNMANSYCEWRGARLPTEAQWEKAARGTDARQFPWGNDFQCDRGNFDDETTLDAYFVAGGPNCDGYPDNAPVGSFESGVSPYGIYDMAGNVSEWLADWFSDTYYQNSPVENPLGPDTGEKRAARVSSWFGYDFESLTFNRGMLPPTDAFNSLGFRCARNASP